MLYIYALTRRNIPHVTGKSLRQRLRRPYMIEKRKIGIHSDIIRRLILFHRRSVLLRLLDHLRGCRCGCTRYIAEPFGEIGI